MAAGRRGLREERTQFHYQRRVVICSKQTTSGGIACGFFFIFWQFPRHFSIACYAVNAAKGQGQGMEMDKRLGSDERLLHRSWNWCWTRAASLFWHYVREFENVGRVSLDGRRSTRRSQTFVNVINSCNGFGTRPLQEAGGGLRLLFTQNYFFCAALTFIIINIPNVRVCECVCTVAV